MKTEKITWKILDHDTLTCMICEKTATMRVSIPWDAAELNLCLCAQCAEKPEHQIIKEASGANENFEE